MDRHEEVNVSYTRAQRAEIARKERAWLKKLCDEYREEWQAAVDEEVGDDLPDDQKAARRKEVEQRLAGNAANEVVQLGAEIDRMLLRTSVIVAATTLLFAVYAFKANVLLSVLLATAAFIVALVPLSPPVRRAWADAYVPRHVWTLLATNDFKQWVIDSWLADRRTAVVTTYKRAHSVAIPVLCLATIVTAVVLTSTYFA